MPTPYEMRNFVHRSQGGLRNKSGSRWGVFNPDAANDPS